ncbi:hypothetical protein CHELA1G2_12876 [Hyphomicrobiales bacterium]|nr:hypothetical protein CHELA1G2_12876 [Hyphomicrobiales bacterium]
MPRACSWCGASIITATPSARPARPDQPIPFELTSLLNRLEAATGIHRGLFSFLPSPLVRPPGPGMRSTSRLARPATACQGVIFLP